MAIGDTVQAGLMRVDSSPIRVGGQVAGQVGERIGQTVSGLAGTYFDTKKRNKELEGERKGITNALKMVGKFRPDMSDDINAQIEFLEDPENPLSQRVTGGIRFLENIDMAEKLRSASIAEKLQADKFASEKLLADFKLASDQLGFTRDIFNLMEDKRKSDEEIEESKVYTPTMKGQQKVVEFGYENLKNTQAQLDLAKSNYDFINQVKSDEEYSPKQRAKFQKESERLANTIQSLQEKKERFAQEQEQDYENAFNSYTRGRADLLSRDLENEAKGLTVVPVLDELGNRVPNLVRVGDKLLRREGDRVSTVDSKDSDEATATKLENRLKREELNRNKALANLSDPSSQATEDFTDAYTFDFSEDSDDFYGSLGGLMARGVATTSKYSPMGMPDLFGVFDDIGPEQEMKVSTAESKINSFNLPLRSLLTKEIAGRTTNLQLGLVDQNLFKIGDSPIQASNKAKNLLSDIKIRKQQLKTMLPRFIAQKQISDANEVKQDLMSLDRIEGSLSKSLGSKNEITDEDAQILSENIGK